LECRYGRIGVREAKDEQALAAAFLGEGVHVLDVQPGFTDDIELIGNCFSEGLRIGDSRGVKGGALNLF